MNLHEVDSINQKRCSGELSDSAFFRSNIPPFPSTTKRGTLFPEFLLDKAGLSDKLTSMCLCFVVSRHENASDLDFQQLQDFALPFEAVSSVRIEFVFDHLLAVVVADVVRSWVLRFVRSNNAQAMARECGGMFCHD